MNEPGPLRSTLAEQFATAWLGRLDPVSNRLRYVVAGHCAPLRIVGGTMGRTSVPEVLRGKGFMLGLDEQLPFVEHDANFCPGIVWCCITDGLVEVEPKDRSMLEEAGLRRISAELPVALKKQHPSSPRPGPSISLCLLWMM